MEGVIAIDGPAGAGKSTIARKLAGLLNYNYLDTGAMYRTVTLAVLRNDIDPNNEKEVTKVAEEIDISFGPYSEDEGIHIYLNGENVSKDIRTCEVDKNVSTIARYNGVRQSMVKMQRKIAFDGKIIMDGRDIGSRVLPDAEYKFYITASLEERARRRYLEVSKRTSEIDFSEVKKNIKYRDKIDRERKYSPLIKSNDAVLIDTTDLSIQEVLQKVCQYITGDEKDE